MIHTNPSSPLSDVLRCIVDIFSGIGDATPLEVGKGYLDRGIGIGPRVVFVPDPRGKGAEVPTGMGGTGYVAGVAHSCDVYVRGAEDVTDIGRFDAAYALADRVINAIQRAARGRVEFDFSVSDASPLAIDAFGADLNFKFTYIRAVQRDQAIWALPANPIAASPPDINRPPGTPASTVATVYTVTPQS